MEWQPFLPIKAHHTFLYAHSAHPHIQIQIVWRMPSLSITAASDIRGKHEFWTPQKSIQFSPSLTFLVLESACTFPLFCFYLLCCYLLMGVRKRLCVHLKLNGFLYEYMLLERNGTYMSQLEEKLWEKSQCKSKARVCLLKSVVLLRSLLFKQRASETSWLGSASCRVTLELEVTPLYFYTRQACLLLHNGLSNANIYLLKWLYICFLLDRRRTKLAMPRMQVIHV